MNNQTLLMLLLFLLFSCCLVVFFFFVLLDICRHTCSILFLSQKTESSQCNTFSCDVLLCSQTKQETLRGKKRNFKNIVLNPYIMEILQGERDGIHAISRNSTKSRETKRTSREAMMRRSISNLTQPKGDCPCQ